MVAFRVNFVKSPKMGPEDVFPLLPRDSVKKLPVLRKFTSASCSFRIRLTVYVVTFGWAVMPPKDTLQSESNYVYLVIFVKILTYLKCRYQNRSNVSVKQIC